MNLRKKIQKEKSAQKSVTTHEGQQGIRTGATAASMQSEDQDRKQVATYYGCVPTSVWIGSSASI